MRKYENVNIDKLKPYENNARTHSEEQIKKIMRSIEEFGFINPVLIDVDFGIIAGHGRVMAGKKLGMTEVPCLFIEDLTEAQKRAYILADNKLALDAGWDETILKIELAELQEMDFDITLTGFEMEDIELDDYSSSNVEEDDYDVEPPEEPKAKFGQIYQLGRHRLMCGDSTDKAMVEKLMDGNKADMVFTDPPYGVSVVGKSGHIGGTTKYGKAGTYTPVIGDDVEFDPSLICKLFQRSKIFLWGANYFANKLENSGKWLVWDKNRGEGTTFSDCELCWTNLDGISVKKYKCTWDGMRREGESGERVHPTQKPLKLCCDIIQDFSSREENIVDLFGGSGSTLIACEQIDRACYMMELDPKYVDVIVDRWEKITGEKAVLLNG